MKAFTTLPRPGVKFAYGNKNAYKLLILLVSAAVIFVIQYHNSKLGIYYFDPKRMTTPKETSNGFGTAVTYSRDIIPIEDRKDEKEIVYASFGTSNTWGATLPNRDDYPYVKRLSFGYPGKGRNFGMRSTGPNYPAACIYSIIKDEEFDVIILEYYMAIEQGLRSFALRLRERFKNAIIIFIRLWAPYQYKDINTNENLSDWAIGQGFGKNFIHDPKFPSALETYGEENFINQFLEPNNWLSLLQEEIADEVGAYIVKMQTSPKAFGPGGWISIGDVYLSHDSYHLSVGGHGILAEQIRDVVKKVGVPKNRELEEFHGLDNCNNWFESGEIGEGLTYSPNGELDTMPNTEKFVLSFKDEDDGKDDSFSGWVEVSNESNEVMDLSVSYMTTGPPPSKYPRVEVTRDNGKSKSHHMLEPESVGWKDKEVHVTRLENIGQIQAGSMNERVFFKPLEKTEYPFRLIGVAITPLNNNSQEKIAGFEYTGNIE